VCRRDYPHRPQLQEGILSLTVYTNVVYISDVPDEIDGFDWDVANIGHIMRHGVTPFEVEEVVRLPHVTIAANTVEGEKRWKLFGKTETGRYLVVVFTIRRRLFRTVTSYEMNVAERRKYVPQIY